MKVDELNQNAALSHATPSRTDKSEQGEAHGEAGSARKQAAAQSASASNDTLAGQTDASIGSDAPEPGVPALADN